MTPDQLKRAWSVFRQTHPGVRSRNAAAALGVTEAELISTGCGENVTRLRPDWYTLLPEFEGLGEVMALTRNDVFVHEKVGHYRNTKVMPGHQMGQVLDTDIDLRIFFRHWHYGFSVVQETPDRTRRSLQFFDQHGVAVHKVHLRPSSNVTHFEALADQFRHKDQLSLTRIAPADPPEPEHPDEDIDQAGLQEDWANLRDTHDFVFLLRRYRVNRLQAFRLAGTQFAWPVSPTSLRTVLGSVAAAELPVMIFVGNHGCLQIHTGPVYRLKETGVWYNILDPGFNLHVKDQEIASAWVVRKSTTDGPVHSLECFDDTGRVVCYLFGKRKDGQTEMEAWKSIVQELPKHVS